MEHPPMFDTADPYLARLREICLALPGADEKISHGRPNFFTKKVFAIFGGVLKGEHDPFPFGQSLLFVPDPADRPALLADTRVFEPAYLGPYGWLGLDLRNDDGIAGVDWTEVGELVDASYRRTAPVTRVRELDARHPTVNAPTNTPR